MQNKKPPGSPGAGQPGGDHGSLRGYRSVSLFSPQILLRRFSLKGPAGQDEVKDKGDERSHYQDKQSIFHEYYIVTFCRRINSLLLPGFPRIRSEAADTFTPLLLKNSNRRLTCH